MTDSVSVTPVLDSVKSAVEAFVAGSTSGGHGDVQITGPVLFYQGAPVARRSGPKQFLLPNSNPHSVEVSDALISSLAVSASKYTRVNGFRNLTSPTARLNDIDAGRLDDFRSIAATFGFTFLEAEIQAVQTAKDFRSRVEKFFTELTEAERKAKEAAEAKELEERMAKAALDWDRGVGEAYNNRVKGEGGLGQRLRVKITPQTKRVVTSTGQVTSLAQAKKAFEFATPFWHGGARYTWSSNRSVKSLPGGRRVSVYPDRIEFGCQTIYKAEAERFAALMGWERAQSKKEATA